MKAYVAVTNKKWFEHLRALSHRGPSAPMGGLHDRVHPPGRALLLGGEGLDSPARGLGSVDAAREGIRPPSPDPTSPTSTVAFWKSCPSSGMVPAEESTGIPRSCYCVDRDSRSPGGSQADIP